MFKFWIFQNVWLKKKIYDQSQVLQIVILQKLCNNLFTFYIFFVFFFMFVFNSKEKDRNYHRSKRKFFNHDHLTNSKQKPPNFEDQKNKSNNHPLRAKSPSKKQKGNRSPSKNSKKSKNSGFSDKDKLMTRQIITNNAQYFVQQLDQNYQNPRQFRSPQQKFRINDKIKERRSIDSKLLKKHSKQYQKDQPRRKQRYMKMFEKMTASPKNPQKTPPKYPKTNFMQQKGQINPISGQQTEQLQQLRQQNQFYKLIYRASLQKMKRLENNIEKQKQDYKLTRHHFQKQLRQLKNKVEKADKVSIGHIYSYDKKSMLKVQPDKIITETDNQASEVTHLDDKSKRQDLLPSRLSIDST